MKEHKGIPSQSKLEKKLLRLVSAWFDISYSVQAGQLLLNGVPNEIYGHLFTSFVISYGRPFFESHRVGKILCDYPDYPRFGDADMPTRHQRMLDLRNKFIAHSSSEGTRVQIVPPGIVDPFNSRTRNEFGFNVGKRVFPEIQFVEWLIELPKHFKKQLETDIQILLAQCYSTRSNLNSVFELQTGHEDFAWNEGK